MTRPSLTPLAQSLPESVPFVGPEAIERRTGHAFRARIGANESGFGPAPSVIEAIRAAASDVWKYGDPENHDIRQAVAAHHGIASANVMIGEGVDGLLGLAARLFLEPGDKVVTSLGAYPTFNFHVTGFGGQLVTVPYENDRESLASLRDAAIREQPRIVYLANPDNPMGTWWPSAEVEAFAAALPETTMLILDEAYIETAPAGTAPDIEIDRPNVLRFRTFSKAYGLAGIRIGYVMGEAGFIGAFDKVRNHFGVNRLAQAAGIAALKDQDYLHAVVARIAASRERIADIARDNGLAPIPSATNFVAIDCGGDGTFALDILQGLARRGVFIRKPMAPVLDRCIRISAGVEADMALLAEMLPEAVREANA